jgi:hypothetical protein
MAPVLGGFARLELRTIVFSSNTQVYTNKYQHKINYFLFCQIFETLFTTCAEILIIIFKN